MIFIMNSRTLKRRLREYELRKRNEVNSELEVREIIKREIESSSLLLGYRFNKLQVVQLKFVPFYNLTQCRSRWMSFSMSETTQLCKYTFISLKCQSLRSNVTTVPTKRCITSLKNVTVHVGLRWMCAKNLTIARCGTS